MNSMLEEVCNVNSKISVDCLGRRYPKIDIQKDIVNPLNRAYDFWIKVPGTNRYEQLTAVHLSDKRYWMSNFAYDKLYSEIIEVTGNAGLGYGMGREFFLDDSMMNYFIGPVINAKGVIQRLPERMAKWNHTKKGIVLQNDDGHFKFAIAHNPGVIVSPFAINYHLGLFDGVAEVCGLVGFETQLVTADRETHYYEFEGEYEPESLPTRIHNQRVKREPHVKRMLEVARKKTIDSREASIRERLEKEKKERQINNFKKFVSMRVINQCLDDTKSPERTLEKRDLAIMFTDLRNFTTLSEKVDNEILTGVLNQYFEELMQPFPRYNGEVDKFLGDAVMAHFPTAYDAVSCGIDMRYALKGFNRQLKAQNIPNLESLRSGIGVSTGGVWLGNIGSKQRMDETVIGDIVNIGSRLEGLTKEYNVSILIDEGTYKDIEKSGMIAHHSAVHELSDAPRLKKDLEQMLSEKKIFAREIDLVRPKGKENEIRIYEVMNSFSMGVLMLRVLYDRTYREALELSQCKSTDLREIQEALEKSTHLFERINSFFKQNYDSFEQTKEDEQFISKDLGDYICQQKIGANLSFLGKIKTEPSLFSNPKWFVKNFNGK